MIGRVLRFMRRRPAPRMLVALFLSLRWRCRVSPSARIDWPARIRIGRGARLDACTVLAQGFVELGPHSQLQDYAYLDTQLDGRISLGAGSAVGPYTVIYGSGGVSIGAGCSIAGQSMIVSSTHTVRDTDRPIREQGYESAPIVIEDDVWLGAQCTVLPGAVIGRGTIVGAKSLVRRVPLPPMVLAAGVPAQVIRSR